MRAITNEDLLKLKSVFQTLPQIRLIVFEMKSSNLRINKADVDKEIERRGLGIENRETISI